MVDDGSVDGSAAIARQPAGPVPRGQANQGVAAARNEGLAAAQGELIAFLDQDDTWLPHKLEAQVGFLRSTTRRWTWWYRHSRWRSSRGGAAELVRARRRHGRPAAPPCSGRCSPGEGDSVERIGGFDTRYRIASDTDWIMRARDAGVVVQGALGVCMRYRMHEG